MSEIESPSENEGADADIVKDVVNLPENEAAPTGDDPPDMGKVIAGVKKKFREKGYQEGLAAAAANAPESAPVTPASLPSQEVDTSSTASAPAPEYQPQVDPVWQNRANSICAEGRAKYEDFDAKLKDAAKKAEHNPTLMQLYQYALGIGNAETVYELLTNPTKRAKMLEDTSCWSHELFKKSSAPTSSPQGIKSPPPPLDELKTPPAKGERTYADQQRYVLKAHRVYRGT